MILASSLLITYDDNNKINFYDNFIKNWYDST